VRSICAVLLLFAACATAPPPEPPDLDIRATVIAEYNVISGPAGRRDWNVFKELFTPDGRIDGVTPADYVTQKKPWFDENGLFRHPTAMRVERHGDTAHVEAIDESRHASNDEKPYAQGTASFDLVKIGDAWKIATIVTK
jgi:SnoaL-like domain